MTTVQHENVCPLSQYINMLVIRDRTILTLLGGMYYPLYTSTVYGIDFIQYYLTIPALYFTYCVRTTHTIPPVLCLEGLSVDLYLHTSKVNTNVWQQQDIAYSTGSCVQGVLWIFHDQNIYTPL